MLENGLYVEGKKVWGRKQVQELRRCLKCQRFGEHKAAQCNLAEDVCGRCSKQHRTSECTEKDREKMDCSNCKAVANGKQKGHGAADRRCPVFLARVERLNMTRKDNNYKYFCTIDPATWETNPGYCSEDQLAGMQRGGEGDDSRWQEGERGSSGGGLRGEGGGGVQRGMDRGWEGVQTGTRAGGNRTHGSLQTEPTNNGNGQGQASGSK